MKKLILVALAAVALTVGAFAQATDPASALKEVNDLRSKLMSENRTGLTQAKFNEINETVKNKALELIKDVDVSKVDAKDAFTWAQLFSIAGKHHETCELAKKFLTTSPDAGMKYSAQSLMMQSCNALGEADQLQETLLSVRVPSPAMSQSLASNTVYSYLDTIVGKLGMDAGIKTLDEVQKNLVFEAPADYAKRMLDLEKKRAEAAQNNAAANGGLATINDPNKKAKTDEERLKELEAQGLATQFSTKFLFVKAKADLYKDANQQKKAITLLEEFVKEVPDSATAVKRSANASLKELTLIGALAPALNAERSIGGDFPGLDALKGKVVLIDFFAHWCGPCIASFPEMKKLYEDNKAKGLELFGFTKYYGYYQKENTQARDMPKDTEFSRMGDFMKEKEMSWPVVYGDASNFDAYGCTAIPYVVVIDKKGAVRKIKIGYDPQHFQEFRDFVEKLLAEK